MAKDNNNINTDELTGGSTSSSGKTVPSTTTEGETGPAPSEAQSSPLPAPSGPPASSGESVPRREENPFSFKHFLKWDGNHPTNGAASSSAAPSGSINHSRSASNINGHGGTSLDSAGCSNGTNGSYDTRPAANSTVDPTEGCGVGSNLTITSVTAATSTGSPSKSATTSSLNVVSSTTGARPKIPQFQSVNTLSSESKMKRSPRFPSFDSQSSLSDFADDRFGSQMYQSRSNGSFNSDYPAGGPREDSSGMERLGEQMELFRGYVQRSCSNYDLDSPVGPDRRNEPEMNPDPPGRLAGAAEFSAALPDFVQDHLVMEQWYNAQPKGTGALGGGGSGSSGSADFDDVLDLTGVANIPGGSGAPASSGDDIPFDLTATSTTSGSRGRDRGSATSAPGAGPRFFVRSGGAPPELGFDLPQRSPTSSSSELPPDLTEGNAGGLGESGDTGRISGSGGRSMPYHHYPAPPLSPTHGSGPASVDKIHRLPDFLSDGPIHSSGRLADVTRNVQYPYENSPHGSRQRSSAFHYQTRIYEEVMEKERLRRELDAYRQTVTEQANRIRELERDLEAMTKQAMSGGSQMRDRGYGSTQSNATSFLQAKKKAATAEAEVKTLKLKINSMNVEMSLLRKENDRLREEGGAIGGSMGAGAGAKAYRDECNIGRPPSRERYSAFLDAHSVALRQAALTAESNLRQLLNGVENLRTMAGQIEQFRSAEGESVTISLDDYIDNVRVNSDDDVDGDDDDDDDDVDAEETSGPAL